MKHSIKKTINFLTHHNAVVVALELAIFAGVIFALATDDNGNNELENLNYENTETENPIIPNSQFLIQENNQTTKQVIEEDIVTDAEPPQPDSEIKLSEATIIFNPTGTHIKDGELKIRVDIYPAPGFKTYNEHYVDGQLTPMLSHFITVSEDATKEELENYIKELFDADTVATLDNALAQPNSMHLVSPYMREKSKMQISKSKIAETADEESIISEVNTRLEGLNLKGSEKGNPKILESGSIDVGYSPQDGNSLVRSDQYTFVGKDNPANGSGILDTYVVGSGGNYVNDVWVGTFSASGDTLTCRDSESIGDIGTGYLTFTGLTVTVATNDYVGIRAKTGVGSQYQKDSGGAGYWRNSGEYIDPGDSATFSLISNYALCLYATGEEAGGEEPTYQPRPGGVSPGGSGGFMMF